MAKTQEQINKEKRERYNSDPLYRKYIIENVKKHINKKAAIKRRLKKKRKYMKNLWTPLTVNGKETLCCKISYLASALDRTIITVRLWEKDGRFPETIRYNGHRYYTRKHFNMIVRQWEYHKKDLDEFFRKVNEKWDELW